MRILIGILMFVVWLGVSIKWYVCGIKELCNNDQATAVEPATKAKEISGNYMFYPESDAPIVNEQSYKTRDSLFHLMQQNPDAKLEIVGLYYANEQKDGLGISRAKNVYSKMFQNIDSSKILFDAKIKQDEEVQPETLFKGILFDIQKQIVLNFANNQFKTDLQNKEMEELKKMVARSKKYSKIIIIEGHTDNVGSDNYNLALSKKRAEWIEKEMLNYGVDKKIIEIQAKGEKYPVSTNDTEEGKQQNRRVKIILN